jgi:hypothetical protein
MIIPCDNIPYQAQEDAAINTNVSQVPAVMSPSAQFTVLLAASTFCHHVPLNLAKSSGHLKKYHVRWPVPGTEFSNLAQQ